MSEDAQRKKKGRSPNFPAISLPDAVEKLAALRAKETDHPFPPEVAAKHLGYSPKSSGWLQRLGAMKAFGLLEEAAGGRIKVSQRGRVILIAPKGSKERAFSIEEAAWNPAQHQVLREKYGDGSLPSDETVIADLELNHGFTRDGASALLQEFSETIGYVRTETGGKPPRAAGNPGEVAGGGGQSDPPPPPRDQEKPRRRVEAGMKEYVFPLPSGRTAILNLPSGMSEADVNTFKAAVELFSAAFQAPPPDGGGEDVSGGF